MHFKPDQGRRVNFFRNRQSNLGIYRVPVFLYGFRDQSPSFRHSHEN